MSALRSGRRTRRAGEGLVIAAVAALSLANLLIPGQGKAFLGLPLALWAPGRCVAVLIFGHPDWTERFDGLIRSAVECVLSLAAWPLLVLAAYAIHPHISATSIELCFLTLAAAAFIRVRLGADQSSVSPTVPPTAPSAAARGLQRAPVAAVAVIVLGGAFTAMLAHTLPPQQGTTASSDALAGSAATAVAPLARSSALTGSLAITIANPAPATRTYHVTATVGGAGSWPVATVTVGPDSQADTRLAGPLPATPCLSRISVVVSDGPERLQPLVAYFRGDEPGSCAAAR